MTGAVGRLRAAGLRCTPARQGVLHALTAHRGRGHLTATQIHQALQEQGLVVELSTVHRVLAQLVDLGEAHTVPVAGVATYGLADQPHHHAVCVSCGMMRQLAVETVQSTITAARAAGLDVDPGGRHGGVVVYGRCEQCRVGAP
ncbi:transcriptional repressor [Micromonospora musae]|uniref:Fur family transcriptional regulator n=1 Tax=Micromonospora musae TaxID=1894970 RepID=UPI0033DBB4CE